MPKLRHSDGSETHFQAVFVTKGTSPPGSTWIMNPIPRVTPVSIGESSYFSGMPPWLSEACAKSGTGSQDAKGEPFRGR
jgi:hypothetical protein